MDVNQVIILTHKCFLNEYKQLYLMVCNSSKLDQEHFKVKTHITLKKRKNQCLCSLPKFLLSTFKSTIQFLTIVLENTVNYIHIFKVCVGGRPQLLKIWFGDKTLTYHAKCIRFIPAALTLPPPPFPHISRYIKNLVWKNTHYFST